MLARREKAYVLCCRNYMRYYGESRRQLLRVDDCLRCGGIWCCVQIQGNIQYIYSYSRLLLVALSLRGLNVCMHRKWALSTPIVILASCSGSLVTNRNLVCKVYSSFVQSKIWHIHFVASSALTGVLCSPLCTIVCVGLPRSADWQSMLPWIFKSLYEYHIFLIALWLFTNLSHLPFLLPSVLHYQSEHSRAAVASPASSDTIPFYGFNSLLVVQQSN